MSSKNTKRPGNRNVPADRAKNPKGHGLRIGKIFLKVAVLSLVWSSIGLGLAFLWFTHDLPDLDKIKSQVRAPAVTMQTRDGTVIGTYGDHFDKMILVKDLPAYVPQAFMAVEDRRFYYHFGVDVFGLLRAAYLNYKAERIVGGGSTITQQLAKNLLFSQGKYSVYDRSLGRKIQELLLAFKLERRFKKDEIMTIYLNRVYFGAATFGIEAASRKYFHKSAMQLNVFEAAMMAGLLKAPSRYSPASHPQRAVNRTKVVLGLMEEAGFIQNKDKYLKEGLESFNKYEQSYRQNTGARFFCDWIYEQLPDYVPVDQDLTVTVTLDPSMQTHAETVCAEHLAKSGKELKTAGLSLVAMTPDGAVRAMVGGPDYRRSQYNLATQALRQPGSAFKMFIYLAALESGVSLHTYIDDSLFVAGNWRPGNYGYKSQGEITVREAFARSVNSVAIRLAKQAGPAAVISVAKRLGIRSKMQNNLSIALGSMEVTLLDLTTSFATFANAGKAVWAYGIAEIKTKDGKILYTYEPRNDRGIIEHGTVLKMRELMRAVVAEGTGRRANIGSTVAGKTGSNGDRDAWFIGYRDYAPGEGGYQDIVTGVWTGNPDNKPMARVSTGGRLPATVFAAFVQGPKDLPKQPSSRDVRPLEPAAPEVSPSVPIEEDINAEPANMDDILAKVD